MAILEAWQSRSERARERSIEEHLPRGRRSWAAEVEELEFRRGRGAGARRRRGRRQAPRPRAASPSASASSGWSMRDRSRKSARSPARASTTAGSSRASRRRPTSWGSPRIDGRPVAIGGEDFTIRGGTSWSGDRKKGGQGGFVEDLAASYRIPLVNLIDGSGGSVTSINRRGHAMFPGRARLRALGRAAGQGAGRLRRARHGRRRPGGPRDPLALVGDGGGHEPGLRRRARRWSSARSARRSPRRSSGGPPLAVDLAGTIDNRAETEDAVLRR